jgi:kynurenine 3-monooxygenase
MSIYRENWIIGAGLAGALLARLLARSGRVVHVSERRSSVDLEQLAPGRSINLALAERGRAALRTAGDMSADASESAHQQSLESLVMAQAIDMPGRQVHLLGGEQSFQAYSSDGKSAIWSVHRARMNRTLLHGAQAAGSIIHFNERLLELDLDTRSAVIEVNEHGATRRESVRFGRIYGCDGAGSLLREAIAAKHSSKPRVDFLDHGYKELAIPPSARGSFQLEPNALHIWPRRSERDDANSAFMLIALPNPDFSFTATLFLANEGDTSFASLRAPEQITQFFQRYFPDVQTLVPDYVEQMQQHPLGLLGTLHCQHWFERDRAVILGDAAHAIVPFHGQGMNCALEDCVSLSRLLEQHREDYQSAFAAFEAERLPQAQAIAQMALENYLEMRDGVADANFLLRKALEKQLALAHPGHFVPRYELVSFTTRPYAYAQARGRWQSELLQRYCSGKTDLTQIDVAAASAEIMRDLAPLETTAGAAQ